MKNRFKWLSLLMILVLALSAGACSKPAEAPAPMEAAPTEAPAETPAEAPAEADVVGDLVNSYFANMPADIYKIPQADFVAEVAAGTEAFILDIRSAADYEAGHIKGAVNAPWGPAIAENLKFIPADKTVYVYCYTGQTAGQAVNTLNVAGFDAKSVNLGWNMGISKVEGVADVTETTANAFPTAETAIDPAVQAAMDAYYTGLAAVKETKYANYKVSEDDLKAMVDAKDESIYIVDARKAEDYAKGHIAGAVNLPFGKGMEAGFAELPMDKTVVVYCYTGQTAGQAVAGMRLMGLDAVSLNGGAGMEANQPMGWVNKGYELIVE